MASIDSRKNALNILRRWFTGEAYIDHLLQKDEHPLNPQSRRFRDALVHQTIQWQRQSETLMSRFLKSPKKPPLQTWILLLMGAAEIFHMEGTQDYGTVHSLVSLAGYQKTFVNAILRQLIRFRNAGGYAHFMEDFSISPGMRHSFPDWLVERWHGQFGHDLENLLSALNQPPVRMVRLMEDTARERVIKVLKDLDIFRSVHPDRKDFFTVSSIQPLMDHDIFSSGAVTIQDVSSVLPEYFFPEGGIRQACDVCSAPGGKTAALLKQALPDGEIFAYDVDSRRLKQVDETLRRLKFSHYTLEEADARTHTFPRVNLYLVDAPCSGFGVIRKRSDLRWRRNPEDLETLQTLQLGILENVSRVVPSGGEIIYSTCTFDKAENVEVLQTFLDTHPEFSWGDPPLNAPDHWKDTVLPILRTYPHRHDCEGSFAGRVKRT